MIEEKDITREKIVEMVSSVLENSDKQNALGENIYAFAVPDANKKIYEDICRLISR